MKTFLNNILVIVVAAAGVMLLLRKGGKAGISRVKQITAPAVIAGPSVKPFRPQTVEGKLDGFNERITLQQIRSWGDEAKRGFVLASSRDSKAAQPHARVTLKDPTIVPIILQIEYAMPQQIFEMIEANPQTRNDFNGVAVQVVTAGSGNTKSVLLRLDPVRHPDHRKWLSYNLTLPTGTSEIDFWITGLPPRYDVSAAVCAIALPQFLEVSNTMPDAGAALTNTKP